MRTAVVGLDAATWTVLDQLVEAGRVPNIASLASSGASGTLESTMPPMTPLAWTTMSTGLDPENHGIYDFLALDRESYDISPMDYREMSRPTVWDVLNAEGQTAGVLNFPVAHPPRSVTPFFVSGIPAEVDSRISNSAAIQTRLEDSSYRVSPGASPDDGIDRYLAEVLDLVDLRADLAIDLVEEYELDHFWTVFMGIDWAQHYAWNVDPASGVIGDVYERVDSFVGALLEVVDDDTTILIVSDHGARRIDAEVHLNSLLREWEYLRSADQSADSFVDRIREAVLSVGWTVGRALPPRVKNTLKRGLPERAIDDMETVVGYGQENMAATIDWQRTEAFSFGYMGRVFLHDEDRYPDGTLSQAELETVREELIERLEELRHPETGAPIVSEVLRGPEIYDGRYADAAPDLLVVPEDWRYMIYGDFEDHWIHDPSKRVADHDPNGVFIAAGPSVSGGSISPQIADVAPTILGLHDAPVPDLVDGRWLGELFPDRAAPERTPEDRYRPDTVGSSADDEAVEDRLEDLGYL